MADVPLGSDKYPSMLMRYSLRRRGTEVVQDFRVSVISV